LNPHRLFDADWHGMGVHVLWRKEESAELRLNHIYHIPSRETFECRHNMTSRFPIS